MATIALPIRRLGASSTTFPLFLGVLGTVVAMLGTSWDVSWHRMIGRDTFWSAPHLGMYAGVALNGLAALVATAGAITGRPTVGRELRIGPLRAELGFAFVGIGAAGVILSAPVDDAWHRAFGRDVDIWSAPHLVAIAFAGLIYVGWILVLGRGTVPVPESVRRGLRFGFLGALAGIAGFSMNFYYMQAVTREAFFYPLLVAALLPVVFAAAQALEDERWAATITAVAYTAIALTIYAVLELTGWRPPAFPPLVVVGVLAVDLVRRRTRSPLALGVAFMVPFVAAEWIRMLVFPPAPPVAQIAADPRGASVFFFYYGQALARPWTSAWPVAAMAVGSVVAALSWSVGRRVGAKLR